VFEATAAYQVVGVLFGYLTGNRAGRPAGRSSASRDSGRGDGGRAGPPTRHRIGGAVHVSVLGRRGLRSASGAGLQRHDCKALSRGWSFDNDRRWPIGRRGGNLLERIGLAMGDLRARDMEEQESCCPLCADVTRRGLDAAGLTAAAVESVAAKHFRPPTSRRLQGRRVGGRARSPWIPRRQTHSDRWSATLAAPTQDASWAAQHGRIRGQTTSPRG